MYVYDIICLFKRSFQFPFCLFWNLDFLFWNLKRSFQWKPPANEQRKPPISETSKNGFPKAIY